MKPRVLILEDDVFLATDLKEQLQTEGFDVIGPCLSVDDAMVALKTQRCDVAVLDIKLGQETSEPVAKTLRAAEIPFVVASAYLVDQQPEVFRGVPALAKPVKSEKLVSLLRKAT